MIELESEHLILRQWREEDFFSYAELTANQEVMKYFPKCLTKDEAFFAARKFQNLLSKRGWGFWAVEEKESQQFLGYAGLHEPKTKFPFSPCIEIAWRMEDRYWANGYVFELGETILNFALLELKLEEVVYFSSVKNKKAESIVKQLGMIRDKKTFAHPFVGEEDSLSEHYLYRIKKI